MRTLLIFYGVVQEQLQGMDSGEVHGKGSVKI
jgi:hypothetical protein